jgi:hypothetical protein
MISINLLTSPIYTGSTARASYLTYDQALLLVGVNLYCIFTAFGIGVFFLVL